MTIAHAYRTLAVAILLGLPALPPARADEAPVPEQIVDTMNQLFGKHAGFRANHAKGIVAEGTFAPSGAGLALSSAALFRGGEVPVTARFSDATGVPAIPDGDPNANPHGMAVRFTLPDGSEMDIVANSLAFFPVATGEDFLALLQAAGASGPDAAKPTPIERFVAEHPAVRPAVASVQTPSSFARETYNGVNAFVFVAEDGNRQPFRFKIEPVDGAEHLTAEEAKAKAPDFLVAELGPRLAQAPAQFRLSATLAAAGDPTRRCHQALARRPRDGRSRHDHAHQGRGRQRRRGEGAAVPADQPDRRHRALGRSADPTRDRRLRGLVRVAGRSDRTPAEDRNECQAFHAHPNGILLLRPAADRRARRAAGRGRLSLPRLPAADRQRVRGAGRVRRTLHGSRHRNRISPDRQSGRQISVPLLPGLRLDRLPYRGRSRAVRRLGRDRHLRRP